MLIKVFKNGQGGGAAPVDYLIADKVLAYDENRNLLRDSSGKPLLKARDPLPEVLAGNPEHTKLLIDSSRHEWSYRAGVVGFDKADNPSEEQQQKVMEAFERLAFAGLNRDQFDILWVRHTHEDRVELHFCTPRLELTTGNSLNIAPPGYLKAMDAMRDMLNKAHGWADPQDPSRAREAKFTTERKDRASSREEIQLWLEELIVAGRITNRSEMTEALQSVGFEIPRAGKTYLTVKDPETDTRWRLKGTLFHEGWTREDLAKRALESEHARREAEPNHLDGFSLSELRERYQSHIERRAKYNQERFGRAAQINRQRHRARAAELESAAEVATPPSSLVSCPTARNSRNLPSSDAQHDVGLVNQVSGVAVHPHSRRTTSNECQWLSTPELAQRKNRPLYATRNKNPLQQDTEINNELPEPTRTRVVEIHRAARQNQHRAAQFADRFRKTIDRAIAQQPTLHRELTTKLHRFAVSAQLFARRVFATALKHAESERNLRKHPTSIAPTRGALKPRRSPPNRSETISYDR